MKKEDSCGLYLISPPALDPVVFAPMLERALDGGEVAAFQLYLKEANDVVNLRACELLMPVVHKRGIPFIINEHTNIAKKAGCDGVHLRQKSSSIKIARETLGKEAIIGVSCWVSRHDGMTAAEHGADYVQFSPCFRNRLISNDELVTADLIQWWNEIIETPCVVGGGLTPLNCGPMVDAGADFICASTAVWEYPEGEGEAVRDFNESLERYAQRQMTG